MGLNVAKSIKCKCEICFSEYEKPIEFKKYTSRGDVFFKWSLKYCDTCRRKKEIDALNSLPKILNALEKNL
jgi:aspartate carbamoyltransferase regulatory subunit